MNAPVTLRRLGADAARFVAKEKKLYIDGKWVPSAEGGTIEIIDPATGEAFDRVPEGKAADIDRAVAAAR
ncbi:MAG: aldehyde dehydrogenase family protein, partial [Proteobacteria bacterium]|nr:aldehyde dehydrogenase family protein [Pseudomonadota bacterium]